MTDDQAKGIVGAVESVSNKIVSSLPAQFLMLVLLNVMFLATLFWFLDRENAMHQQTEQHLAEARERVLLPILTACLQHKGD